MGERGSIDSMLSRCSRQTMLALRRQMQATKTTPVSIGVQKLPWATRTQVSRVYPTWSASARRRTSRAFCDCPRLS
jgi:hypothetical protein